MTTEQRRPTLSELLEDARVFMREAQELVAQGSVRNAAEKAWGATWVAAGALAVAYGRRRPESSRAAGLALEDLAKRDERIKPLDALYDKNARHLHGYCFYDGVCEPAEVAERVQATEQYLNEIEKLVAERQSP